MKCVLLADVWEKRFAKSVQLQCSPAQISSLQLLYDNPKINVILPHLKRDPNPYTQRLLLAIFFITCLEILSASMSSSNAGSFCII